MMGIDIVKIRLRGITQSIQSYTSEFDILSIIDSIPNSMDSGNYELILFACQEISKWYNANISKICSNEFVYHPEVHKNNIKYIDEIIGDLLTYSDEYKKIIASEKKNADVVYGINEIARIIDKFHLVVYQLRIRHGSKETLDVEDEYDVQDLLHSLLHLYFDDIRPEEWTPSYAGTSSRQDFLLKNEKIVIETKMTRKGLNNKELANELLIDIPRYKQHPDCKELVCFIFDPEHRIRNPRGFEKDIGKSYDGLKVSVFIRPIL